MDNSQRSTLSGGSAESGFMYSTPQPLHLTSQHSMMSQLQQQHQQHEFMMRQQQQQFQPGITLPLQQGSLSAVQTASAAVETGKAKRATMRKPPQESTCPQVDALPLLPRVDWVDKAIWTARQLFGGQALNGFQRATASVQRIKKQRARQTKSVHDRKDGDKKRDTTESSEHAMEELLKVDVMNARTAKKMKLELELGMQFCVILHETVRACIYEMGNNVAPPPPLVASMKTNMIRFQKPARAVVVKSSLPAPSKPPASAPTSATASTGMASDSKLRKQRKKKVPPSTEPPIPILEFENGKRLFTKKEFIVRVFEYLRFRSLKTGDFVAARLTSRDLWILATVQKDYNVSSHTSTNLQPVEFLQLSEAKKSQLFKEKVVLKDVEDSDGALQSVARSLVLPLPRSYGEAAEWCSRLKKGYRVYAMYPNTTSLYSATVVDSTTYCRGDDDIIVVEFDGDEPDTTLETMPKCHIPARFVTLIPREFPSSQPPSSNKRAKPAAGSNQEAFAAGNDDVAFAAAAAMNDNFLDDMDFDADLPGLDFDDMDFTM